MTRWGGGGSITPTKKTYVPAENAAKSFVPEQLKVTNNEPEVGAPNLDGGVAKELEGGEVGGRASPKRKENPTPRVDQILLIRPRKSARS